MRVLCAGPAGSKTDLCGVELSLKLKPLLMLRRADEGWGAGLGVLSLLGSTLTLLCLQEVIKKNQKKHFGISTGSCAELHVGRVNREMPETTLHYDADSTSSGITRICGCKHQVKSSN